MERRIDVTFRTMLLAVLTVAGCWVLVRLFPVVLVVVVALFLVGTLNPAVEWLEAHKFKRGKAIAVVFVGLGGTTALFVALTLPSLVVQVRSVAANAPEIRARLAEFLSRSRFTAALGQSLWAVRYDAIAKESAGTAFALSTRAIEFVAYLLSAVFLALYVLIDRDRLRGGVYALVPRRHHVRFSRVLVKLETIVGGYIRGQVLTSALMAVFTFVLLMACGVANALALAVFSGLADVLPYIGVFLSVGPAAIAASSKGLVVVGIVVAAMLVYEELESRFLVPRIYGRALRLPSSMVLLSLLVGGTLMGIVGALLALPVAAAIRMLVEELRVELPGETIPDANTRASDARAESEYEARADGMPAEQAAAIAIRMAERRQDEDKGVSGVIAAPVAAEPLSR